MTRIKESNFFDKNAIVIVGDMTMCAIIPIRFAFALGFKKAHNQDQYMKVTLDEMNDRIILEKREDD